MAASALGGWVGSACITKLVDMVCSYAGDQYEYQREDTKDKLRSLKKSLLTIQAVVHKAERLQTNETNLESWLRRIKDAACQAEDVLDLFDYRVLAQAEDKGNVAPKSFASATAGSSSSSTSTTTSTTTRSGSTVKRSVSALKHFLLSDEDINKLTAVVKKFDEIHSEIPTFLELVKLEDRRPKKPVRWRTTTSMPGTTNFFGRVYEKTSLKRFLMQKNENSNKPYDVISVVGIGGVGKTALVQTVYSHFLAKSHFDFTVWLHVSDKFNVKRLTKEMVQSDNLSISADLKSISSLDQVQRILQDKLNRSRILIVLDDVWNELSSQWENLCKPRGYFSQCAFGDANPSDFPELENIGQQMMKKLAGSPLAAKTVGDSLKLKLDENHWRAVCESKLWQIEQKEDGIISSLRLSYEHLPDYLKECLVYLALFPKNCQVRGDVLIQMWRAHGFLNK